MRLLLRVPTALSAATIALSCARGHPSPPSPVLAPAIQAACSAGPRLLLDSLVPAPRTALSRTDTLRATVLYCMPRYEPHQWFVFMVFGTTSPGVTRTAAQGSPATTLTTPSGGVVVIQPVAALWADPDIHWPLQVYIKLNRSLTPWNLRSADLVTLGPFEYTAAPSGP